MSISFAFYMMVVSEFGAADRISLIVFGKHTVTHV